MSNFDNCTYAVQKIEDGTGVKAVDSILEGLKENLYYRGDSYLHEFELERDNRVAQSLLNLAEYVKNCELKEGIKLEVPEICNTILVWDYNLYSVCHEDSLMSVEKRIYNLINLLLEMALLNEDLNSIIELFVCSERNAAIDDEVVEIIRKYYFTSKPENKAIIKYCLEIYMKYRYNDTLKLQWVYHSNNSEKPFTYYDIENGYYLTETKLAEVINFIVNENWTMENKAVKAIIKVIFATISFKLMHDKEYNFKEFKFNPENMLEKIMECYRSNKPDIIPWDYDYAYKLKELITNIE